MAIHSSRLDEVLNQAVQNLNLKLDKQEAQLDAELLLAFCLEKSRTWLKTWPEHQLSTEQQQKFTALIERRLTGEPVAYMIGEQEFWSLQLKVTRDTLIPRPETELLVELALAKIPFNSNCRIADLGTGTGAIALALATERSQAQVFAVDFSEKALVVAKVNRDRYQLDSVTMVRNSWLEQWSHGKLDLIVANPPYVAAGDPHLANLSFEPLTALVADNQGYSDIIDIATQAKDHLNSGAFLMFEHGFEQAAEVRNILKELGYQQIESFKDLSQQDRVTIGQYLS